MDVERLVFEMFKEEYNKNKQHLVGKITHRFKNISEERANNIATKIYNYQIEKYGNNLALTDDMIVRRR